MVVGLFLEGVWGPLWNPFPYSPPSQRKEDEDELSHAGSEEASMLSEFADDAHGEGGDCRREVVRGLFQHPLSRSLQRNKQWGRSLPS